MHHLIQEKIKEFDEKFPQLSVLDNDGGMGGYDAVPYVKSFLLSFARSLLEKEIEDLEGMKIVGIFEPYTDERYEQDAYNSLISTRIEHLTNILKEIK